MNEYLWPAKIWIESTVTGSWFTLSASMTVMLWPSIEKV